MRDHTGEPRQLPSLRSELLLNFGVLAAAALLVAVVSTAVLYPIIGTPKGWLLLGLLVVADVAVFVVFGAYQLRRLIDRPLADAVESAVAIAGGDLGRRMPPGRNLELANLAGSVNRMTDHLIEAQVHRARAEKMAGVGRLAAGVAHEIGNPLGAINGYTHILRQRVGAEPRVGEALDGLERESARIDRIVRGLLDYSKPRTRTPSPFDVNDTVIAALRLLHDQGVLRGVTVQQALDDGLPSLTGERHELEQVFVNLVLNAVDAMPNRSGKVVVHTSRVRREDLEKAASRRRTDAMPTIDSITNPGMSAEMRPPLPRVARWLDQVDTPTAVKVVVADSGSGVSTEDAERIFDPFFTTKEPGKGTGLGLAIVARVVESLGGIVWVTKAREGGAAFHILLPARDEAVAAPVDAMSSSARAGVAT